MCCLHAFETIVLVQLPSIPCQHWGFYLKDGPLLSLFKEAQLSNRVLEDYAVLYFGPAMFKIGRLLLVAMMCALFAANCQWCSVDIDFLICRCVHFFACAFFRVKEESAASPDDVSTFYSSRGVNQTVCIYSIQIGVDIGDIIWSLVHTAQDLPNAYVSS